MKVDRCENQKCLNREPSVGMLLSPDTSRGGREFMMRVHRHRAGGNTAEDDHSDKFGRCRINHFCGGGCWSSAASPAAQHQSNLVRDARCLRDRIRGKNIYKKKKSHIGEMRTAKCNARAFRTAAGNTHEATKQGGDFEG